MKLFEKLKVKFKNFIYSKFGEFVVSALSILGIGWLMVYDMTTLNSDWDKSDNILEYSLNLFGVIVFGTVLEAMYLVFICGALFLLGLFCYWCWFVVVPMLVVFFAIVFFRWLHVKKVKVKALREKDLQ